MRKFTRKILLYLVAIVVLYVVLLIPDREKQGTLVLAEQRPFLWQKDSLWVKLEMDFRHARTLQPKSLDSALEILKTNLIASFLMVEKEKLLAIDNRLIAMQDDFFALAPLVAVKQNELGWYINFYSRLRRFIKHQSLHWNMNTVSSRDAVYSLLYGMRAAVEEVMLQAENDIFPAAIMLQDEPSANPSANILGIPVHSGDMLVSRGGAAVSALISRGNDYPGNFSHVALLYVDENTSKPWLIEAHIEKGLAVSSLENYLKDKKLRLMAMRPRASLSAILNDPLLPHKAAKAMYDESFARHIPYDFKMNFFDSSAMFCSEVASYAYRTKGLQFWQPQSTISSAGVVQWLHDFGVENFVTQMPSDLEYDPKLAVVAEWRDPETLYKDHLDNAVMDAMLMMANKGKEIDYNTWQLPYVRIVKAYCVVKNWFGGVGIIPEGMSATRALKNQEFVAMNTAIKEKTMAQADAFKKQQGYRAPYWQLVKFAEQSANSRGNR